MMTDRSKDPYGVPTGTVPRVSVSGYQRTEPLPRAIHRECATFPPADRCSDCRPADPIQQAVDDWLLMERKARAWDRIQKFYERGGVPSDRDLEVLEVMGYFMQEPNHV